MRLASEVADDGVQACAVRFGSGSFRHAVAVPVAVSVRLESSRAADITLVLGQPLGLEGSDGSVSMAGRPSAWAVSYSDTPPQCLGIGVQSGNVHWGSVRHNSSHDWSAWLVIASAADDSDPTGQDAAGRFLLSPYVKFGSGSIAAVTFSPRSPAPVVTCSASDPAAGAETYLAIDVAKAYTHGCETGAGKTATERTCDEAYPHGRTFRRGKYLVDDRQLSLNLVCSGAFGRPDKLAYTTEMQCAVMAFAASYSERTFGVADKACEAQDVIDGLTSGSWASVADGVGCQFFGAVTADAALGTPAGRVIGSEAYFALKRGLPVACEGALGGGHHLGVWIESHNESAIAVDVIRKELCIAHDSRRTHLPWRSVRC